MLIINQKLLDNFSKKYANSRKSIIVWVKVASEATWKSKQDVLLTFPKAKMLKNNRARFEIVHNQYRLIAEIDYLEGLLQVRFIGTHAEYDKIDATTI